MAYNYLLGVGGKKEDEPIYGLMTEEGGTGKAFLEDVDKELQKISEKHRQDDVEGAYVDRGGEELLAKGKKALGVVKDKAAAAGEKGTSLLEEAKEGTEMVMDDLNLPKFTTDKGKEYLKTYGAKGIDKYKEALGIVDGISDIALPDDIRERFAAQVAARPDMSNMSEEDKASVAKQIEETMQESEMLTVALDKADPNTKEGKQLWDKVADSMGVPFEYLKESWDKFDEAAGGVPGGLAGLVGSGAATIKDGAAWLNSKVDFLTMLAAGAAAGAQSNSVGVAVVQGLASGIQARQQQAAEKAKAAEEARRYAAEQNRENYKALTARRVQEQGLLKEQRLNASDIKQAESLAEDSGVAVSDIQSAIAMVKAKNAALTKANIGKALAEMGVKSTGNWIFNKVESPSLL